MVTVRVPGAVTLGVMEGLSDGAVITVADTPADQLAVWMPTALLAEHTYV